MTENFKRRDVLRSAGIAGVGTTAVSGFSLSDATPTGFDPVRLVDVGLAYELPEGPQYFATNESGDSLYSVIDGEAVIHPYVPEEVVTAFEKNSLLFGAVGVHTPSTTVTGPNPVEKVPTETTQTRVLRRSASLAEQHNPPKITVQGPPQTPSVVIDGDSTKLSPEEERTIELDPVDLVVATKQTTDEVVPIEGVPEDQWGPRTEFGEVRVRATPRVKITDHGELPISQV